MRHQLPFEWILNESMRPDDHLTQPIGGAGGRIACGVITKM